MKRTLYIVIVATICMVCIGCKPSVPGNVIQPDDMEDILYDYYLSREMAQKPSGEGNSPYLRTLYYKSVLKKHGVTEAEFDSSLVYYYGHADDFAKIFSRVSDRMQQYGKSIGINTNGMGGTLTQYSTTGDTANIWRGATSAMLLPVAPYNRFDFEVKADTSFHKGDSFMFTFMTNYLFQQGTKDATAYIDVKYSNDSISSFSTSINISGQSQLRVMECSKHDIKLIRGFIYLNRGNDESETVKLMFIDNIQFVRFHKNESNNNAQDSSTPPAAPRRDDMRPIGGGIHPLRTSDTVAPVKRGGTPNGGVRGNRPPPPRQ
ncbi:MAG: DUF4296 domain-containing protein [Prevotella sp.]